MNTWFIYKGEKRMETIIENGRENVTVTIVGETIWEREDKYRIYFNLEADYGRAPIDALYEVIEGGSRDNQIEYKGRTFGYTLGIDCNSGTKRDNAIVGVEDLIKQIVSFG